MRVKIRGLVFVGFAAAVFAQSAMANDATDAKTVTSKLYVDQTFQTLNNITTTSELTVGSGVTEETVNAHWASNSEYPSMAVLKSVKDTVTGMSFSGDELYIDANTSNGATTISLDTTNLAGDAAAITATGTATSTAPAPQDKLVKASAVNDYAQAKADRVASINNDSTDTNNYNGNSITKYTSVAAVTGYAEANANKATAIITSGTGQNNTTATDGDVKYPTTKAVYDFVTTQGGNYQPKTPTTDGTSLYLGHNTVDGTTNTADWKKLEAAANANSQASTDYVTIMDNGSGVYQINIPTAQIAASGDFVASNGSNDAARAKLATAGTVYDFVNGNYQAKSTGTAVQVGYNDGWTTLAGGDSYVNVAYNSASGHTQAEVSLTNIGTHGVAWTDGNSQSQPSDITNASTKIVTGQAVHEFVMAQLGNLPIPAPGADCDSTAITSSNDKACALVLAYWSVADSPTGQAGVGLKWVPMAQTVSSGSSNQQGGGEG